MKKILLSLMLLASTLLATEPQPVRVTRVRDTVLLHWDGIAPVYRVQKSSGLSDWQDYSGNLPSTPMQSLVRHSFESSINPVGGNVPATVVVGPFGSGWLNDLSFGTHTGYWDLGRAGKISLRLPPQPAGIITLRITEWQDGGIFSKLAAVIPSSATLLTTAVRDVELTHLGKWVCHESRWFIDSGIGESILIVAPEHSAVIDQIEIDTGGNFFLAPIVSEEPVSNEFFRVRVIAP